jgi:hypothetical protein
MQLKLLGLAAILLIVWFFLRRRSEARKAQEAVSASKKKSIHTAYHAVSIKFGKDACAAAKSLTGERFLASEAPQIPLPGCDAPACECRFTHHKDRRSGKDRRSPFGRGSIGGGTGRFDAERRQMSDRRKSADDEPF